MRTILSLAALAAMLTASPAAATVTFKSASFTAQAQAIGQPVTEGTSSANSLPTSSLFQYQTSYGEGGGGVARADGFASFDDATGGTALLHRADVAGYYVPGADPRGGTARLTFAYTFAVDREYIVRLNAGTGYFGTNPSSAPVHDGDAYWKILNDVGDTVLGGSFKPMGPDLVFSAGFGPGTYTLELGAFAYTLATPQDSNSQVVVDSSILFDLIANGRPPASGTPEPATWALLIGGFGMAGTALRRRRVVRG